MASKKFTFKSEVSDAAAKFMDELSRLCLIYNLDQVEVKIEYHKDDGAPDIRVSATATHEIELVADKRERGIGCRKYVVKGDEVAQQ